MNNQIKGMFYYYSIDVIRTLKIFFTIITAILIVFSAIGYLFGNTNNFRINFILPFATYINVGIIAYQLTKGNVSFALKMGAIRKNIYLMQLYFMLVYSALVAILSSTLESVTEWLLNIFNITNFSLEHPAALLNDTWAMRILVDFSIMFFIMILLYLIGLFFYRTGLIGGGILMGGLLVIVLYGISEGWIIRGITSIISNITIMSFVILLIIGFGLFLIGYPFMRRITIVKAK